MVLMALSELRGCLMMEYLSQVDSFFTDLFKAMGLRAVARVLGSLKVTLVHIFCFLTEWAPFFTAEAACLALYKSVEKNGLFTLSGK